MIGLPAPIQRCAFFLDVDGTLCDIQPRPEMVRVPAPTAWALQQLHQTHASVALISGRPIAQLDDLFDPLSLPCAGIHGLERRRSDGERRDARVCLPEPLRTALIAALAGREGVEIEDKGTALAVHYRAAPEQEAPVRNLVGSLLDQYPELTLQPGKCVLEIRPQGIDKGGAIYTFMRERPFIERVPIYIGDDLTDESAFAAVNRLGGLTIKVGSGPTRASLRMDDPAAVSHWLVHIAELLPTERLVHREPLEALA